MYDPEELALFTRVRSEVHKEFIAQQEKTKRLTLIIGSVSFISGLLVLGFYPEGRAMTSIPAAIGLVIFAAGAFGYNRLWGKGVNFEFSAEK
ncbi:hypothetical protein AWH62_11005 [Maricaulis sp. W15]|nr:hypothetical protein AWH62_11005 [Maricaulis sp. W15]